MSKGDQIDEGVAAWEEYSKAHAEAWKARLQDNTDRGLAAFQKAMEVISQRHNDRVGRIEVVLKIDEVGKKAGDQFYLEMSCSKGFPDCRGQFHVDMCRRSPYKKLGGFCIPGDVAQELDLILHRGQDNVRHGNSE